MCKVRSRLDSLSRTLPLEVGLVGHWTFDGPDMDWGSTTAEVQDVSGNGNDGNTTNMNSTSSKPGVIGQAMVFDGVSIDHSGILDDLARSTSWLTVSAWIMLNSEGESCGYIASKAAYLLVTGSMS